MNPTLYAIISPRGEKSGLAKLWRGIGATTYGSPTYRELINRGKAFYNCGSRVCHLSSKRRQHISYRQRQCVHQVRTTHHKYSFKYTLFLRKILLEIINRFNQFNEISDFKIR